MSDRTERETDALVAEKVMGWRTWIESRGSNVACVTLADGEPWDKYRYAHREGERQRYTETTALEALAIGFFGQAYPHYTTDARDDYSVLCHVRKTWDHARRLRFQSILGDLWAARCDPYTLDSNLDKYEVGDFSRAALAVIEETK